MTRIADTLRLGRLSMLLLVGRRPVPWLAAVLLWPLVLWLQALAGLRPEGYSAVDVQGLFLSVPLDLLAIGLGSRLIAADLTGRTLEAAYGVPGGARRVWLWRLAAAGALLLAAELLLALATHLLFADVTFAALAGALVSAAVYLALALVLSVALRSEAAAAMVAFAAWLADGLAGGFGGDAARLSPSWNALAVEAPSGEVVLQALEHHLGFLLMAALLIAAGLGWASRSERMLQ